MAVFFALLFLAHSAHAAPMSLRDAAVYALGHSPQLDASESQALIAELTRKNSTAALLPSLDFASTHGLQRYYPQADSHEPWASNFTLTLAESLYDNGESLTKHRIATVQEQIARLSLERDRDRLLLAVSDAFYQLSLARKNLEIQQEQHAVLKLQVELVKDSYRQGVKTRKDYLRFQTQLNRSDIDLLTVRDNVQKAEIDLRRVLGVPLGSNEAVSFAVDETVPVRERPARVAIENHRDYRIADLTRQVNDLNTDIVHRRQLPQLGLTASATYGSSGYLLTGVPAWESDKLGWNALLTLNYNLFDFGTRRRNSEIAAQQAAAASDVLAGTLLDLRQELDKLQVSLRELFDSFQLSQELLRLERANLALITNEYRQGKVQYLDYINSLQNFSSAKSTYYTSLYELRKSQLAERYHEGTIYEAIQNGR
jgi:outer membrane protein